jgi:hypothetical protein
LSALLSAPLLLDVVSASAAAIAAAAEAVVVEGGGGAVKRGLRLAEEEEEPRGLGGSKQPTSTVGRKPRVLVLTSPSPTQIENRAEQNRMLRRGNTAKPPNQHVGAGMRQGEGTCCRRRSQRMSRRCHGSLAAWGRACPTGRCPRTAGARRRTGCCQGWACPPGFRAARSRPPTHGCRPVETNHHRIVRDQS